MTLMLFQLSEYVYTFDYTHSKYDESPWGHSVGKNRIPFSTYLGVEILRLSLKVIIIVSILFINRSGWERFLLASVDPV